MTSTDARERAQTVIEMEHIVRCLNDEEIFETWLSLGVADGDITENTTVEDIIDDEYYIEDQNFSELMGLFIRLIAKSKKNGGLYVGGITSSEY